MLKRTVMSALVVAMTSLVGLAGAADRGEAKLAVGTKNVVVEYGRPNLGGRDMLGKAEVGTPWRLGSGSPTTLTSEADLSFGSQPVAKGKYVLRAVKRAADKWDLLVTPQSGEGAKALEIPLAVGAAKDSVETLTIELRAGQPNTLVIAWATTTLSAEFSAK
jgi:hypothetical protein